MEGVKIIDTVANTITETQNVFLGSIVSFLIAAGFMIITVAVIYHNCYELTLAKALIVIAITGLGMIVGGLFSDKFVVDEIVVDTEVLYTVVVSDDVRFNEFYNKYEILGQDGSTFTVRERSSDTVASVAYTDNCAEDVLSC